MKNNCFLLRVFKIIGSILILGVGMSACAALPGSGSTSWKEEALLHDGSKIIVERTVQRGGRHEVGQQPPIREQSLIFAFPHKQQKLRWEDNYSEDVGAANFNVRMIEIVNGTAYVLASPAGCLSYNKWGRPNPPYVIFKNEGKSWQRIALQELPGAIKRPNLISSSPDTEVEKSGTRFITSEMVAGLNASYRQPEFRSILREPLSKERCPQYSSGPKAPNPIAPDISVK